MNGIIGVQRPNSPGVSIYMNPLGAGVSRLSGAHSWGTPFDSFWCCYGTAVESFSKLGDSIYFKDTANGSALWINQFVSSSVEYNEAGLVINQKSNFPAVSNMPFTDNSVTVRLDFTATKKATTSTSVWMRIPFWAKPGTIKVTVKTGNNTSTVKPMPGRYYELAKVWDSDDYVIASFSPTLRSEHISDDRPTYMNLSAIMYGPLLLCGITTGENELVGDKEHLEDWVVPVDEIPLHSIALYTTSANKQYIRHSGFMGWVSDINPEAGTDAPDATFKVSKLSNASDSIQISSVNYPNFFLTHKGDDQLALISTDYSQTFNKSSTFHQTPALLNTSSKTAFSLELGDMPGYYISTMKDGQNRHTSTSLARLPLYASKMQPGQAFAAASTFTLEDAVFKYKPYSFVALGANRDYLLQPLNSMVDEQYTAYFNITMP